MRKLILLLSIITLSVLLTDCTCKCNRQYSHKMDSRLIELLEYDDEVNVKPFYTVEIKLNTDYSVAIGDLLTQSGANIESTNGRTLIAKAQPEAIRKISKLGTVDYITLLTSNYYPNK